MSDTDPFPAVAARYISATLGVEVEEYDRDGRQGAHDLRYVQDGRSVAVEVKAVVDQQLRQMDAEIAKVGYTQDPDLTRLWLVYLEHGARIKTVRREVPGLLHEFEARGWRDRSALRRAHDDDDLDELVTRLSVVGAFSSDPTPKHPPGFYLLPAPWGGWDAGIASLPGFAGAMLSNADSSLATDLRRQLGAADADERHAFLFLGWENEEAWSLMNSGDLPSEVLSLPTEPPVLPAPIDGLWLSTFFSHSRTIAWLPGRGWIEGASSADLGPFAQDAPHSSDGSRPGPS